MIDPFDYSPRGFWSAADQGARDRQLGSHQNLVASRPGWSFGEDCSIS